MVCVLSQLCTPSTLGQLRIGWGLLSRDMRVLKWIVSASMGPNCSGSIAASSQASGPTPICMLGVDVIVGICVEVSVDSASELSTSEDAAETTTFPRLNTNPMMVKSTAKTYKRLLCDINISF